MRFWDFTWALHELTRVFTLLGLCWFSVREESEDEQIHGIGEMQKRSGFFEDRLQL